MDDYISREKAIKELREVYENEYPAASGDFDEYASHDVPNILKNMPSTDVQPVVRCKDCKHRKEHHYEEIGEKPYIKYDCNFTKYSMSPNGFCSFGARMDGDTNGND